MRLELDVVPQVEVSGNTLEAKQTMLRLERELKFQVSSLNKKDLPLLDQS